MSKRSFSRELPALPGFALGHECVARVTAVGDAVRSVKPGDVVVVPWAINCGTCDRCRSGRTSHCSSVTYGAMYGAPVGGKWGGLFSDVVRVPFADAMLVPLPSSLDPVAMASAGDNWTLAYRLVVPHLKQRPGGKVVITAVGSIGLYAVDIARAHGASEILYVDPKPEHRAIASELGATETAAILEPRRHGYDLAIEAAGSVKQLSLAIQSLVPEGFCESAGNHYEDFSAPLPMLLMYFNAVTFRVGRDSVRPNIGAALELAQSGAVTPRRVVSDVIDWEELPSALLEPRLKPVFVRAEAKPAG